MVYVGDDGEVVCDHLHPKQLLNVMRHVCKGKQEYDRTLCAALNKETKDGRDMRKYSDLLHQGRRIKLNFPSTAYLSSPHSIPLSVVLD